MLFRMPVEGNLNSIFLIWNKVLGQLNFEMVFRGSLMFFADVINNLPRKILGYHTPDELFEKELDRIYAA